MNINLGFGASIKRVTDLPHSVALSRMPTTSTFIKIFLFFPPASPNSYEGNPTESSRHALSCALKTHNSIGSNNNPDDLSKCSTIYGKWRSERPIPARKSFEK